MIISTIKVTRLLNEKPMRSTNPLPIIRLLDLNQEPTLPSAPLGYSLRRLDKNNLSIETKALPTQKKSLL